MHEATIAKAILDAICEQVAAYGPAAEARSVALRCGEFRNVDPDSLRFAFESLRKDVDGAGNCQLDLEIVPALASCGNGHQFSPQVSSYFCCTACGAGIASLLQGEELDVCRITLECEDEEVEHARKS